GRAGGRLLRRLWNDDGGAILASEWLLIATILVLGLFPGGIAVRPGVLGELVDVGNTAASLDQSYSFCGQKLECPCWGPDCPDHLGFWDNGDRRWPRWDAANRRAAPGRWARDNRPGRPFWTNRDSYWWENRTDLAVTPGSQAINPRPTPFQLDPVKPTPAREAEGVGDQACD